MGLGRWLFKKVCSRLTDESVAEHPSFLCDFGRICHEIIPGDVLLIEGTNKVSELIKRTTHSQWTHAALYIGRLHSIENPQMREAVRKHFHGSAGQQLLVETIVGQGTKINPIQEYSHNHIRICRPSGLSHQDAQRVIGFALKHVGNTYDTRLFIDLGRFLLAGHWFVPRRWRSSLFQKTDNQASRDICSALIAEAFISVKFPILPLIRENKTHKLEMIHRNPKLFSPSDFDYSPYFSIIKYPIYPQLDHGIYRDLPWREELISHDEGIIAKRDSYKEINEDTDDSETTKDDK